MAGQPSPSAAVVACHRNVERKGIDMSFQDHLPLLIHTYGYWVVAGIVMLESIGVPLPGEATLIAAAVYAGETHNLNIWLVIAAAATGGIIGDNVGFWIGETVGYRLFLRYGARIGITERKIKLGQYLFRLHGSKVVFFGRFVAVLRVLAAILAGVNRMPWTRFFVANMAGAICWAYAFGYGAYALGGAVHRFAGPVGIALAVVALAALVLSAAILRGRERALEDEAVRAIPGPLPRS